MPPPQSSSSSSSTLVPGRLGETAWSRRGGPGELPLLIAHRGASAVEAENSIAAFARARADGADGVELDVLLCATGEVMVFHDDDLLRLAGLPARIADLSLAELRSVRLRSGATIPTLQEAIEACGEALLINVELKAAQLAGSQLRALVEGVASCLERAAAELPARVLVSSFNPRAVLAWRRRMPEVCAGLLIERESFLPLRRAWALPWLRPFSVHPEGILCTPEAVSRWHRRGYRVAAWTIDEANALRGLADMRVDAIITNHPARSRALLLAPR